MNKPPLAINCPVESSIMNFILSKGIISEVNPVIETIWPGKYSDSLVSKVNEEDESDISSISSDPTEKVVVAIASA